MFTIDGKPMKTWNVLHGCTFECSYCSVRQMVATRFKDHPKYMGTFEPRISERELARRNFKPGDWVFVGYMGDVACQPVIYRLKLVLDRIRFMPDVNFYLQSKNPEYFVDFLESGGDIPENVVLGTTMETNRLTPQSSAPSPADRYFYMRDLKIVHRRRIMISVEPVMDFNLSIFLPWLQTLRPERVFIGADNYGNNLPEPSAGELHRLIDRLRADDIEVIEKPGLERLL
jgi:hypothetical protein